MCYNAIDRHALVDGDQVAMIWEGDEPTDTKEFTYDEMLEKVSKIANALKSQGVKKGDVVTIYMPMIPELPSEFYRIRYCTVLCPIFVLVSCRVVTFVYIDVLELHIYDIYILSFLSKCPNANTNP